MEREYYEYSADGRALCMCGCGEIAPIYNQTNKSRGIVKGEPAKFIKGHNAQKQLTAYETGELVKLCECGCGEALTPKKISAHGVARKGEVGRFISGHNTTRGECELRDGVPWKKCQTCKTWKSVSEDFYPKKDTVWGAGYCKMCQKNYQLDNAEQIKQYNRSRRWAKWGFTDESMLEYYEAICGACEICGEKLDIDDLNFDHDHSTDEFRGLLCSGCNLGIGHFKENQEALEVAIKYLGRHRRQ